MSNPSLTLRVAAKRTLADDIVALELVGTDRAVLPPFEAGAHIDLKLPNGLIRSYSLYGRTSEPDVYRIAVLREANGRGGSHYVHDELRTGDLLTVGTPRNNFPLRPAAFHLLLAGGIGITPLLSMAWALFSQAQPFRLYYFARTESRMAFRDELATAPFASQAHFHCTDDPSRKLALQATLAGLPSGTHIYTCGPAGFIDWVETSGRAAGLPKERMHHELFAAAAPIETSGASFDVFLARSNISVNVAAHESIVNALQRVGIDVPVSCEQGVCGTCVTAVLDGLPEHRDSYLMDEERTSNRMMTLCCSRSRTARLVLDL